MRIRVLLHDSVRSFIGSTTNHNVRLLVQNTAIVTRSRSLKFILPKLCLHLLSLDASI